MISSKIAYMLSVFLHKSLNPLIVLVKISRSDVCGIIDKIDHIMI